MHEVGYGDLYPRNARILVTGIWLSGDCYLMDCYFPEALPSEDCWNGWNITTLIT